MNVPGETESAPGFGSLHSPVVIVGQSLCGKPCMDSQIPFTGGSGKLIDEALAIVGKDKSDVFTTTVVHCHPPRNRKSLTEWIENCTPYLHRELDIFAPRLIIGLGGDAATALQARYSKTEPLSWEAQRLRSKGEGHPDLWLAPHPSHILKPWAAVWRLPQLRS
jgi:uracil-DNA glycosylase family 4